MTGTPYAVFDGVLKHSGGTASGSMFPAYEPSVVTRLGTPSPLVMNASYTVLDGQVEVTTDITVDQATAGANRRVYFFVTSESEHGNLNMVRAMLPTEPFTLTAPGQSMTVTRSFPMDAGWTEPNMNIIVLVQDAASKNVYQSAQAVPDYAGQVRIDCDPDGVEAAWSITGPGIDQSGTGDFAIDVFGVGTYTVTWEDVPYWDSPVLVQQQTLVQDGTITFTGAYTNGPFTAVTGAPFGDVGAGAAISLVDVDGDGNLDVHMTSTGGTDRLLLGDGTAAFVEVAGSPLAATGNVVGAAWADMTGDGAPDVYLALDGAKNQLYINDGSGGFAAATTFGDDAIGASTCASFVDYDQDGKLDLSVGNTGGANVLLKGQGEIAPGMVLFNSVGGNFALTANTTCIAWGDGNMDGRLDPFVVNGFSGNVLFENTAIGFSDLTAGPGMGDLGDGRGAAWGDFDNDGDFDLYVANNGQADLLYRCDGPFQYSRVAGPYVGDRGHGRGVAWLDLDNDGFLDLYVVRNGEPDLALLGDGAGGFARVAVGPDEATTAGNAVATGDVDGDGRLDLAISREGAANVLLLNSFDSGNHWLRLDLTGSGDNTDAVGARVVVTAGGVSRTQLVTPGSALLACSAPDPHFGLGAATIVDRIDIHWPSGLHQVIGAQLADQVLAVTEGVDVPSGVDDETLPRAARLGRAHPNPFNPSTTISFTLDRAAHAVLTVYTVEGRPVRTLADAGYGPGTHRVTWNGTDAAGRAVASGTYLYRLETDGGFAETGRMALVK